MNVFDFGDSVDGVFLEHLFDEVVEDLVLGGGGELDLAVDDGEVDGHGVVVVADEGLDACVELVDDDGHGPVVDLERVALAHDHLGRHVEAVADDRVRAVLDELAVAQVAQRQVPVLLQNKVLRLHVAVHHTVFVQVAYDQQQTREKKLKLIRRKRRVQLRVNRLRKVDPNQVLAQQVHVVVVTQNLHVVHDQRVVDFEKNLLDFFHVFEQVFAYDFALGDALHRVKLLVAFAAHQRTLFYCVVAEVEEEVEVAEADVLVVDEHHVLQVLEEVRADGDLEEVLVDRQNLDLGLGHGGLFVEAVEYQVPPDAARVPDFDDEVLLVQLRVLPRLDQHRSRAHEQDAIAFGVGSGDDLVFAELFEGHALQQVFDFVDGQLLEKVGVFQHFYIEALPQNLFEVLHLEQVEDLLRLRFDQQAVGVGDEVVVDLVVGVVEQRGVENEFAALAHDLPFAVVLDEVPVDDDDDLVAVVVAGGADDFVLLEVPHQKQLVNLVQVHHRDLLETRGLQKTRLYDLLAQLVSIIYSQDLLERREGNRVANAVRLGHDVERALALDEDAALAEEVVLVQGADDVPVLDAVDLALLDEDDAVGVVALARDDLLLQVDFLVQARAEQRLLVALEHAQDRDGVDELLVFLEVLARALLHDFPERVPLQNPQLALRDRANRAAARRVVQQRELAERVALAQLLDDLFVDLQLDDAVLQDVEKEALESLFENDFVRADRRELHFLDDFLLVLFAQRFYEKMLRKRLVYHLQIALRLQTTLVLLVQDRQRVDFVDELQTMRLLRQGKLLAHRAVRVVFQKLVVQLREVVVFADVDFF